MAALDVLLQAVRVIEQEPGIKGQAALFAAIESEERLSIMTMILHSDPDSRETRKLRQYAAKRLQALRQPRPRAAKRVRICEVPFPGATGKKEFLFPFDYGDEWHFGVKLVRTSETVDSGAQSARVRASQGEAPPQYANLDDDEDREEDS